MEKNENNNDILWVKEFPKQEQAFQFSDEYGGLPIFSKEFARSPGKRSFFVTSWEGLWNWITVKLQSNDPKKKKQLHGLRTLYELIRTGKPCHMYVDAEYYRDENPDLDAEQAATELIERVKQEIEDAVEYTLQEKRRIAEETNNSNKEDEYFLNCSSYSVHIEVHVLDASIKNKESKHFCFRTYVQYYDEVTGDVKARVPAMFQNNDHCRLLAIHWMTKVVKDPTTLMKIKATEFNKQITTTLLDGSVYSANRNMRLILCTKAGQDRPFLPIIERPDGTTQKVEADAVTKTMFYNNLITYIDPQWKKQNVPMLLLQVRPTKLRMRRTVDAFVEQMDMLEKRESTLLRTYLASTTIYTFQSNGFFSSIGTDVSKDSGLDSKRDYRRVAVREERRNAAGSRIQKIAQTLLPGEVLYGWREFPATGRVRVSSLTQECKIHKYTHGSNHTFIDIYTKTKKWKPGCYHDDGMLCKLLDIPEELREETELYYEKDRKPTMVNQSRLFGQEILGGEDSLPPSCLPSPDLSCHEHDNPVNEEERPSKRLCTL